MQWMFLPKFWKSGPFGNKEPNKKHMTSRVITCIHRRVQLHRTRRDMRRWGARKELVSLYILQPKWVGHIRHRDSGGALFLSTAFMPAGVMEAISDCLRPSHITCFSKYLLNSKSSVPENGNVWKQAACCSSWAHQIWTHLRVNHSRLTYSVLCPTCSLTYGKWIRFFNKFPIGNAKYSKAWLAEGFSSFVVGVISQDW